MELTKTLDCGLSGYATRPSTLKMEAVGSADSYNTSHSENIQKYKAVTETCLTNKIRYSEPNHIHYHTINNSLAIIQYI
jgi:hypothetical protein